jgi:hypothetical protein
MERVALELFPAAAERCPVVTLDASHTTPDPFGTGLTYSAWAYPDACHIVFGSVAAFHEMGHPRRYAIIAECGIIAHEYGHLAAGNTLHDPDPDSIMHETGPHRAIPKCVRAFKPHRAKTHRTRNPGNHITGGTTHGR